MRVVFWTKQAQANLAAIRAFISQDSPHYASVIVFRLIAATDRLAPFPMKLEVLSRVTNDTDRAPLLFVHGSCHAAWCWEEHFLAFFAAAGFNTHALSLRGHGRSEGSERLRWASVSDYVEDVPGGAAARGSF